MDPVLWTTQHAIPEAANEPRHDLSADCWCRPDREVNLSYGIERYQHRRTQ